MYGVDVQIARAKVNLALHVVSRRNDGFHELDSLVCFPEFGDEISSRRDAVGTLLVSGEFGKKISETNNLVLKALNKISLPNKKMSVHLKKNIPVAAGLGGGSADAAAIIRSFSNLWGHIDITMSDLVQIGSDVPVCLDSSFQRMRGLGNNLKRLKSNIRFFILLVNSGTSISTNDVFSQLVATQNSKLEKFDNFTKFLDLANYLKRQRNDLEKAAFKIDPNLVIMKNYIGKMRGCSLARLSGSGGTIFGIFETQIDAFEALRIVKEEKKLWWARCCPVNLARSGYDIVT